MRLWVIRLASIILFVGMFIGISAQATGEVGGPIDLNKLSPADSALLEVYKDSFQRDLDMVLDLFAITKLSKTDTSVYDIDKSSHAEAGIGFVSRILVN